MAISSTIVWEVRPTNGSDTNGGGFKPGASGTDFSQQGSAQFALTGLTTSGASATIATASAATTMVGNLIQITGGTNFTTGFYEIISVVAGVSITVDRNATSGVGAAGTGNVGGAIKTITKWNSSAAAGNSLYVKAEATITVTAQIAINMSTLGSAIIAMMIGYTTTRGDNGQVTIQASSGLGNNGIMAITTGGLGIANFTFDGNSQGGTAGLALENTGGSAINCVAKNCTFDSGFSIYTSQAVLFNCRVTGCGSSCVGGFRIDTRDVTLINCISYANACPGFAGGEASAISGSLHGCIAANNTGGTSDGFKLLISQGTVAVLGCIAYGNGRDGFRFVMNGNQYVYQVYNCISYGNAAYGINVDSFTPPAFAIQGDYNAYGGNSTANLLGWIAGAHDVTLSGDPTTAGGSNNFALNNTAGAGAACRAAGFPGVLPVGGTGHVDIGPLQSASGGGGTTTYVVNQNITRFVEEAP